MKSSKRKSLKRVAFLLLAGLPTSSALAAYTAVFTPAVGLGPQTANTGLGSQVNYTQVYRWDSNDNSGSATPGTANWLNGFEALDGSGIPVFADGTNTFFNSVGFSGGVSDDALFNQSSGTFVIAPKNTTFTSPTTTVTSAAPDANSITFTGGANYDFTRAATLPGSGYPAVAVGAGSPSSSVYAGWLSVAPGTPNASQAAAPYNLAGYDSFSAGGFADINLITSAASYITLGNAGNTTPYSGKVMLRSGAGVLTAANVTNAAYQSATIYSGTLELHNPSSLPALNLNQPKITLAGGELAVNIDAGYVSMGNGTIAVGSTQLAGQLTVTANSTISNNEVNDYGYARQGRLYGGPIVMSPNTTLTVNAGGGASLNGAFSTTSGTATIKLNPAVASSSASSPPNGSVGANILSVNTGGNSMIFDIGSTGIIQTQAAINGTANLGHVIMPSGAFIVGSSNGMTVTTGTPNVSNTSQTISIGAASTTAAPLPVTISGIITNAVVSANGGTYVANGAPLSTSKPNVGSATNSMVSVTYTAASGNSTISIPQQQYYNGATTISGGRTVSLGNVHALGDGSSAVTVGSATTLDTNGITQTAGKQYVLSGGSLVNNSGTPVTLSNGVSAGWTINRTTTAATGLTTVNVDVGSGAWMASVNQGSATTLTDSNKNAGQVPQITFSAPTLPGGVQATGHALLSLGWARANEASIDKNITPRGTYTFFEGNPGSGYVIAPKVWFDPPDLPGGRPIKVAVTIGAPNQQNSFGQQPAPAAGTATAVTGWVQGISVIDPGFGYTKIPQIHVDNTGTGGSGFAPLFSMTMSSIVMDNGGSGYNATPTMTFGVDPSTIAGGTSSSYVQNITAVAGNTLTTNIGSSPESAYGAGGFGNIVLAFASTSNIGGTGSLLVDAIIQNPTTGTGTAGILNKTGAGVTTLTAVNTFPGALNVNAGTLWVNGTNSGGGTTTVNAAILGGKGTITGPVIVTTTGTIAPGNSIGTFTTGATTINGTFAVEYDDSAAQQIDLLISGALTLGAASAVNFINVGAALAGPAYVFETYTTLAGTFATSNVPAGYSLDYNYLGGNQIALVQLAVPEPSTMALMVVGLGAVALIRRRKMA
jgi:autotransporter-associated beta strand protein